MITTNPLLGDAPLNNLLVESARRGRLSDVTHLLSLGADPLFEESHALRVAAANGHTQCVKRLIPPSNPKDGDSKALCSAAENGHADCVQLLIPVCDPKAKNSIAIYLAASHGRTECVGLLVPFSDFQNGSLGCLALTRATEVGDLESVKLLIPVSESLAFNDRPFREAVVGGHVEIIKALLAHASTFLASFDPALALLLADGRVSVVSAILSHEPTLFDSSDQSALALAASANGHDELAEFFSQRISKRLADAATLSPMLKPAPSPRL